jgi:hypothetical protein
MPETFNHTACKATLVTSNCQILWPGENESEYGDY